MIDQLVNAPVALPPHRARVLIESLAGASRRGAMVSASRRVGSGYDLIFGVARIEVDGVTVNRLGSLRPYAGMTGYDGIRQNFLTALDDPAVHAIVLDIDSPGGQVAGCLDLADLIYQARGEKPVWAIAQEALGSAYVLASAVRRLEGAALMGERALAAGLVDQVAAPDAAFRALLKQF